MNKHLKKLVAGMAVVAITVIGSSSVGANTDDLHQNGKIIAFANSEAIQWASSRGIIEGDSSLNSNLTEGQFAVMVSKYFNMPESTKSLRKHTPNSIHFADDAYNSLVQYGVPLNGYLNETARNQPVTRGVVANALAHLVAYRMNLSDAVEFLQEYEIVPQDIHNDPLKNFNTTGTLTKAEAVTMLYNLNNAGFNELSKGSKESSKDLNDLAWIAMKRVDDTLKFDVMNLINDKLNKVTNTAKITKQFEQGNGYQQGLYDKTAILPTTDNWNKQSRFSGPAKQPKVTWTYGSGNFLDSAITISKDGTIYTANAGGSLLAIGVNGKEKWQVSLPANSGSRSKTVIGKDGTIYYTASNYSKNKNTKYFCKNNQCSESVLFAITPTGKVKWYTGLKKDTIFGSPAIDESGNIHVSTGRMANDSYYYKVSSQGKILNTHKLQYEPTTTPILTKSNRIFVANYLFDGDKFIKRTYDMGAPDTAFSTPVVDDQGNFYYGTYTGSLGFAANDGTVGMDLILDPSYIKSEDGFKARSGARISVTPVIGKNKQIYIGTEEGMLYGLPINELASHKDAQSSNHLKAFIFDKKNPLNAWTYKTDGWVSIIITDKNGTIYTGTENGTVYALNPSGKLLWKVKVGNENVYDLAIGDKNNLFVLVGKKLVALK
ncbi:outer membrane protein assembly factor BamB [Ureibacillus xyleni]|uniref:Outer membrane protein assembly factor BamB n=1 Tax=Ureibacillus xyleni TaxID=614648 RepID=A0A285SXQ3_9BACL|nr:PQQ-binding-like beta-propeller repeat protein [Ureibacillus xyleni]SOC11552.1 outer membrane protein assembly factor BamB [Ureibacillus xyleni]